LEREVKVASSRKTGRGRKVEGTKEPTTPPPQTLVEWVASHTLVDANLLAEYRSSLEVHGERAENRIEKEFGPWLVKFAKAVDENEALKDAWQKLKSKCDVLLLLRDLHLFTYPEDFQARKSESAPEKFVIGTGIVDSSACHSLLGNASLRDEVDGKATQPVTPP
jgi:hypothetical protein